MTEDGSIVISVDIDDKQAQAELTRLQSRIRTLTASMETKQRHRSIFAEQAKDLEAQYKAAIGAGQDERAQQLAAEYDKVQSKIATIDQQLKLQQADLDATTEKAGQYAAQLSQIPTTMQQTDTQTEKTSRDMEKLGDEGGKAAEKINSGMSGATSGIAKFGKRIIGLAKRVFVFSLITRALRGVRSWLGNLIGTNNEAAAALAKLKGALLTLAQPILNAVIPALTKVINVITGIISAIASLVSTIFGTTVEQSAAAAESLYNEQNAISGVGGAAKKAAKQLANFDEINKLAGEDAGGGGGGSSSVAPNFQLSDNGWLAKLKEFGQQTGITDALKNVLDAVRNFGAGLSAFWKSDAGAVVKLVLTDAFITSLKMLANTLNFLAAVLKGDLWSALDSLQHLSWNAIFGGLKLVASVLDLIYGNSIKKATGKGIREWVGELELWVNKLPTVSEAWRQAKYQWSWNWIEIKKNWKLFWNNLPLIASRAWQDLAQWWGGIKLKIMNAWNSLKSYFQGIKTYMEANGITLGQAFVGGLKVGLSGIVTAINAVISIIENALNWIVRKINSISFDVPNNKFLYGDLSGQHIGFNIQPVSIPRISVPELAAGAVIPPNREFLAVLGDQKQGTNIEAPLETIVAAVRQALGNRQTIVLELDRRELGRAVADVSRLESQRVGLKIGGSYA